MSGPLSVSEAAEEVKGLEATLMASDHDRLTRQALFVQRLSELEGRCAEVEHVDTELARLTAEADRLGQEADPQAALRLVRDLAALKSTIERLSALADAVVAAATRLTAYDGIEALQ